MGKKYSYSVLQKTGATTRVMKKFSNKKEAEKYYNKHPRAAYIQRYTNGVSSGLLQPGIKEKVRRHGKTWERAYRGPFTKRDAEKHVKGFNKGDKLKAIKVKNKKGWFVYIRDA